MGGGGSKQLKDDAPPTVRPPKPKKESGKKKEEKDDIGQARKRIAAVESKVMQGNRTRVDEDVSDDEAAGEAYDSDLERELEEDLEALRKQEPEDEHRLLAIQDKARNEALQWTTLVLPPSDYEPAENSEFRPDEEITLDFVHGYRGWDCLSNVFYTVTDEILYFAGAVGLVLEPVSRRQKQYMGPAHKKVSEICSIALHPGGSIVATAERALNPTIFVWDLSTLATVRELTDAHQGGVSAMSFSKDGKRLVSAGMGQGHVVAVWEWKNDKKSSPLCTQPLKTPKIFALGYNPRDDVIVACGVSMIEFLRVGLSRTGQRVLEHLPGVFAVSNRATHDVSPSMLCMAFTKTEFSLTSELQNAVEGLCITGSDIGNVYLWKREEQIDMIVAAHKGSVYSLSTFVNGFASGGKDGKVRMWNNDLDPLRTYDISAAAMSEVVVKAIDQKQGVVLIGTASCEILQLDQDSGEVKTVTRGHRDSGVYAVATHPTKALYGSVGNDSVLRLWDLANKKEWKRKQIEGPGRSVAFSPDGKLVAVGHHLGSWSIHRIDNMDEIASGKDRKKAIWTIKFSPNLRFMAVGSDDAFIDLYDCVSDYDWLGALQGHSGPVKDLDWSEDSRLLQSCGEDQDLLYWNVQDQTMIAGFEASRNTAWDSWTSTVGWPVQGLVGSGVATTSCCRSLSSHLVATANSDGLIRLFRFPCVVSGAEENMSGGHVGAAQCVRFSFDDGYLVSVAESDRCVFQWLVSSEAAIGFDALDPEALAGLEVGEAGLGDKKKDMFEQQRLNQRAERLEREGVPMMDPGKELPGKDLKARGKEAVKGSGADDEEAQKPKDRKAPDQPGMPENLPDVEDEVEELDVVADSDIERELKVRYHRGPALDDDADGDTEEVPEPGEPLFNLKPQTMAVAPTKYKKPDDADDQPSGGLQMEFVYGFRAHDTRNGAQYTGLGEITMIAGATAVVYSPIQHTQRFFNGHTDDVICQALHPDMVTVATGQAGKKALLCVWDSRTMQTLAQMRGFHDHGICSVGFNGKGNLLVSLGMDSDHSLAVWNWQKGAKVASATGYSHRIFCVAFNPADDSIVTCGVQHVKFWTVTGRLLRGKTGDFSTGGGTKEQAFVALTVSKKGRIYTGSEQGEVYRWKGMAVESMVLAHEGPVFALWVCRDGLCSGGKDGKVSIWSLSLNHLVDFDMRSQSVGLEKTRIRSCCWLVRTVLVGTIDSELFEIDIEAGLPTLLLQGHRAGEIRALVCHPSKRTFVTGGADWTVRVWDMEVRKQLNLRTMECAVCAVAISLDGNHVTVGLENGKVVVLNLRSMRPILERKDRKKNINELKYSTNGKFLAVGSDDCFIDVYDVLDNYEWVGTSQGHMHGVLAVDWSTDSKQLHSHDRGKTHRFWDVESTKEILVAAEVRDVEWSTWTSTMGWPALGIAPKFQGPVGINTACRSSFGDTLATGDDWGMLKLFRFPCITPGARCKRYGGHSARVGKIRFSFEEKTMVSVGLVDGLIIQWRYLSAGKLLEAEAVASDDDDEMEMEVRGPGGEHKEDSDVERELSTKFGRGDSQMTMDKAGIMTVKSHRMVIGKEVVAAGGQASQLNVTSLAEEPADAMAGAGKREWRKPMDADEAPYNCLQLEHVYGYRGHDCRNNLVYNEDGMLVYMVGAVGVVYRKEEHMQSFYSAHTDDVISLAIHPDRETIATGQVGKSPIIHLWSSKSMQTLTTLRGFHELGIAALGFNKDGSKLASVGLDLDHSIAVWEWKTQTKLATAPGSTEKIFDLRFNPVDDVLVSCGVRHIKFWTLVGDNQLKSKRGVYGQEGVQQTMLCNAFTDAGLALTGAQSGDILLWKGSHLEWQFEEAHKGPVFALSTYPDGFVSGGKDGRVRLWSGLDPVKVFDFSSTAVATTVPTRIRSACWRDGKVLVGTMSNEIFEVDERTMTQRLIVQSHAGSEVWGLDCHPSEHMFCTGGEDRTVRVYKVSTRKPSMVRELEDGVKCVAYSPDGRLIAVGLVSGKVMILEYKKLHEVVSRQTRELPIADLKFSPDGRFLATACLDGALDVYDAQVEYELVGSANSSPGSGLIHLDWSADSLFIQTDNTERLHQYWDATAVIEKIEGEEQLARTKWHTWTCIYGWSVRGLIPRMGEPVGLNAVARAHSGDVLAVANDFGLVRLYRFPCPYVGSKHKRYAGHSSLVSKCCFTFDDKYLITVGAADRSIFQWEHVVD